MLSTPSLETLVAFDKAARLIGFREHLSKDPPVPLLVKVGAGVGILVLQLLLFAEFTEEWFLLLNLLKEFARRKLLDLVIRGSGGKLACNFSSFT